jgi:hypothetical protein
MTNQGAVTIAVLQPGYLPWLGFFDQMQRADIFVLYDDVQYDKHSWRNRNRIKTPMGAQWLTVPVRHSGLNWPALDQVRIDNGQPWARKHITFLKQTYSRAPYVKAYLPALERVLSQPWGRLLDLDVAIIELLADWLDVRTPVVLASSLGVGGERSARLLGICAHFGATRYLSGDAARDYLDQGAFARAGVDIVWQQYAHPVYSQLHGAFVSHLSAIDALLNCGEDAATLLGERAIGRRNNE